MKSIAKVIENSVIDSCAGSGERTGGSWNELRRRRGRKIRFISDRHQQKKEIENWSFALIFQDG